MSKPRTLSHPLTPVDPPSSAVAALGYDSERQELHARFNTSHTTYVYEGVSPSDFAALQTAGSIGKHFNAVIKPGRKFRKEEP